MGQRCAEMGKREEGSDSARQPGSCCWLNQVEIWLSKLERDVIVRGIVKSTDDLTKKLMRYIRENNKTAKPIKWKYADPGRRIRGPVSAVTVH
jgi:hypothetical protein